MDLEQFVSSALTQITKGIISAQEATLEAGAVINPTTEYGNAKAASVWGPGVDGGDQILQVVSFDLVVTVADASKASGEGGIQVLGLKVGGGVGSETTSSSQSKISFSIPVIWPILDYKKARAKLQAT